MTKKGLKIWLILTVLVGIPVPALAFGFQLGNEISLPADEKFDQNLYIGANKSDISSEVNGDLSVVSNITTLRANVSEDATVAGRIVNVYGTVKGDLRVAGGKIFINGTVDGDLVAVGGVVHVTDEAQINGDAILLGGRVIIDGPTAGFLKIISGQVTINNTLSGNAQITTQDMIFGSRANITGNIDYFAPQKGIEESGSDLNGIITFNQIDSIRDNSLVKQAILSFINFWILLRFVTVLILSFILIYIFRVFSQKTTEYAIHHFGKSLLFGFLFLIILPIISAIFLISLIALPLGILFLLAYFFFLIISSAVSGIVVGTLISKVIWKKDNFEINFRSATIGVILLTLVQFVPIFGEITRALFFLVALGAVSNYIYMNIRWRDVRLLNNKN